MSIKVVTIKCSHRVGRTFPMGEMHCMVSITKCITTYILRLHGIVARLLRG